jgi:replicative DNA helicase
VAADPVTGRVDIEQAFIGACLSDPKVLADATVGVGDFENPTYANIWQRMLERQTKRVGVSQALLAEDLPQYTREIWESTDYLSEMALATHHEQSIKDRATRRLLKMAAIRIASIADAGDMDDIVDRARAEVDLALRGDGQRVVSMLTDVREVLAKHREHITLIPSPWHELNNVIGGFGPGRMYVFGARPGVGKSALASQIAYSLAADGPVIFATMEMDKGEVYERILSQQAQIYYGGLKATSPDFLLARQEQWLANEVRDIRVLDQGTQTVASIRAAVRSASRDGKVAGVIVDYIHLLSEPGVDNEVQRIASITRQLKQLAMDFKVPIIALSQLNRQVSGRENPRPNLGDLRGSGAIEQDGDCVIFLYKDTSEGEAVMNRTINVYVGKNRQGASFIDFPLEWQGDFVRAVDQMPGA